MVNINYSAYKNIPYDILLDNKGHSYFEEFVSGKLIGFKIVFDKESDTMAGFHLNIGVKNTSIELVDEDIKEDMIYYLKQQPRDGFGQLFTYDSDYYFLSDLLYFEFSGLPNSFINFSIKLIEV